MSSTLHGTLGERFLAPWLRRRGDRSFHQVVHPLHRLSYADVAEWLAERDIMVDRSTIYRWVRRFLALFAEVARSHLWPVGGKWHVEETYSAASMAVGLTAIG